MITGIDHVVILVAELEPSIKAYRAKGFTVTPGGEHADGTTHNALISLADGSYLELIAFKKPAGEHRWWRHVQTLGEGLIDFALLSTDLAGDIDVIKERGLSFEGPITGGRLRPDGQELIWQTGFPPTPELPFLIIDLTPRRLRVPDDAALVHENQAQGINLIGFSVENVEVSAGRYAALLGKAPTYEGASAYFTLGKTRIELSTPAAGTAAYEQFQRRGDSPARLVVRLGDGKELVI